MSDTAAGSASVTTTPGAAGLPRSLVPYENGSELALLYMSVFILLAGWGAGPFTLDARRSRR